MPEAQTDVKEAQVVDGSAAAAKGQTAVSQIDTGATDVKLADGQAVADATVPYSRFEEANATAKAAQEAAQNAQGHIAQLQAQIQAQPQGSVPQPTDPYSQTVRQLGLQDEAYLTTDQQGQVFNSMFQAISVQQADASFVESHPDYAQVVGTSDATGRFIPAAPLQRVLAKDPQLGQAINNSPQGKRLAYSIAIADSEYQESLKKGTSPEAIAAADAKAVVEAAARQASISAAGTGGGTLDKAAVVANMSNEEFKAYKDKIIAKAS